MNKSLHSVELIVDSCIGCTDCIKRCPTEAIRVRNGKAIIRDEACIDCGMCIRVCRNHAKRAVTDDINMIKNYKYRIAIPAPSLYSQFKNVNDSNIILTAIKRLGFNEVFEVSAAAELVTKKTVEYMNNNEHKKPIISSACPAVIRLISMRFPELLDNILPMLAPFEIAAIIAKDMAVEKRIKRKDIGVFFISPCAAKKTNVMNPIGIEKSEVDGVFAISDLYISLRNIISSLKPHEIEVLCHSTHRGMNWALHGGESGNIRIGNAIAVDSMENVINVLEEVDNGQIMDVDFIEALACTGGCVGGPLVIDNCFIAQNTLKKIQKNMALLGNEVKRDIIVDDSGINYFFTKKIQPIDSLKLDTDVSTAIDKMSKIEEIYKLLPGIDCGACGAPTCQSLAEDIVQQNANIEDCVFMLRNRVKNLAEQMIDLTSKMPQTLSDKK